MLNELQQERMQILLNDELMLGAIQMVFNDTIEKVRPRVNEQDDNLVIGQRYRAYEEAKSILAEAFLDMQQYKKEKKIESTSNRAL